jgi:hypothetical protein
MLASGGRVAHAGERDVRPNKSPTRQESRLVKTLDIDHLDIDGEGAKFESLEGKRVGRLVVHMHRSDEAKFIVSCKSVDWLEIWGWKEPDLASLQGLPVRYLRLIRGRQTSVKGLNTRRLRQVWAHSCGKLKELCIPRLPALWLWGCNNFDLDSLDSVRGLSVLDIGPRREIRSLAFVSRCRFLKCLMIDTNSWKTKDFTPLARARALELVGLSGTRLPNLEAVSKAKPELFIGMNAADYFIQGGRRMTKADYLKRRRAFNRKYGI